MKATVLVDNISHGDLKEEWGLSIYIEYHNQVILLDTGSSSLFAANAQSLGLSLEDVDFAVLSHNHFDHGNGMESFFEHNSTASFYLQTACRDTSCYSNKMILPVYIGIPKTVEKQYAARIRYCQGKEKIGDGIYLLSHSTPGLEKIGKREKMLIKKKGSIFGFHPDNFLHEQSLIFETEKGLVIFNSCSHGGVLNILKEAADAFPDQNIYAMIGGFHLYNKPAQEVKELSEKIINTGISLVYTGHCTGPNSFDVMKSVMGDSVQQMYCGLVMEF